ncbi:MAG: amidohydrolase family protein [Clostridiales bacterium]|nr:amidohydrolase family protein [Clostridiales bacterium]
MDRREELLLNHLRECPVIDTHEHLLGEADQPDWDVLSDYTRHYFNCDLVSAGMPPDAIEKQINDPARSVTDKWNLLEPYWEAARNTGYGWTLDLAAQAVYGVDGVRRETVEELNNRFRALRAQKGYGRHILRDLCGIERVMDNAWRLDADDLGGLFWFVTQIDGWVCPDARSLRGAGDAASSIDGWVDIALRELAADFAERGARGLKCALAYQRSLLFEKPRARDAQAGYRAMREDAEADPALRKAAQDHIMHAILAWANERGLILQVHTGYQEGNGNMIAHTNPVLLNNVIGLYPGIRFDLFHMGYPYQREMGALGKMYPNVRMDLCWAHMISPIASRDALAEWLSAVPATKIFAFGGDCLFFDGTAGHLELARRNVAASLARLINEGALSDSRARRIGEMLFYDNPKSFYQMP